LTRKEYGCELKLEMQCTYKRNIDERSRNHCCRAKQQVLHILSVCP